MIKAESFIKEVNEIMLPHFFHELISLKKDISTKNLALTALLNYIKKHKKGRYYLDTLNWLKRLSDKEYLKLYKQFA